MEHPTKNRRYPRVGLEQSIHVAWQGVGGRLVSQIVTVGLGGLFIKASEPPAVGDVIRLYFQVPGGEIRARAIVRSSVPGLGMGIQFTAMEPEARGRLTRMLRTLLDQADPKQASETVQP